jgi:hypothetical protein
LNHRTSQLCRNAGLFFYCIHKSTRCRRQSGQRQCLQQRRGKTGSRETSAAEQSKNAGGQKKLPETFARGTAEIDHNEVRRMGGAKAKISKM